jgi:hypothetical protein
MPALDLSYEELRIVGVALLEYQGRAGPSVPVQGEAMARIQPLFSRVVAACKAEAHERRSGDRAAQAASIAAAMAVNPDPFAI